jgi:hypothetical protein
MKSNEPHQIVTYQSCSLAYRFAISRYESQKMQLSRVFFATFDTQLDTQYCLLWLSLIYTSEHQTLLPRAYLHVALEQVAGDDEMLDSILQQEAT